MTSSQDKSKKTADDETSKQSPSPKEFDVADDSDNIEPLQIDNNLPDLEKENESNHSNDEEAKSKETGDRLDAIDETKNTEDMNGELKDNDDDKSKKDENAKPNKKRKRKNDNDDMSDEEDEVKEPPKKKRKKAKETEEEEDSVYTVEEIVGWKMVKGECLYEVKWENYDSTQNTYEPLENLAGNDKFEDFIQRVQLEIVDGGDESGLLENIRSFKPEEFKEFLLHKYENGDNHDKLALMGAFNMTQERDPKLRLDMSEISK